jgi:hypothetical protein
VPVVAVVAAREEASVCKTGEEFVSDGREGVGIELVGRSSACQTLLSR